MPHAARALRPARRRCGTAAGPASGRRCSAAPPRPARLPARRPSPGRCRSPLSGVAVAIDAGHVAVADQHDARAGLAHLGDQLAWRGPVEDADDEVGDLALLRLGEFAQVLAGRRVEIDDAVGQAAADRDLVHVDVGRVAGSRRARPCATTASAFGPPLAVMRGALERIERDVDLRARRRRPSRRYRASAPRRARPRRSPRCRRWRALLSALRMASTARLVGRLLVAAAHQPRGGERRRLGDAHRPRARGCGPSCRSAIVCLRRRHRHARGCPSAVRAPRCGSARGGSSTASQRRRCASARARIALSSRLVRRQHDRHRLARRAAALQHRLPARRRWSRSAAVTSAITPGRSTTISRR